LPNLWRQTRRNTDNCHSTWHGNLGINIIFSPK
jgi:hypothetical protein